MPSAMRVKPGPAVDVDARMPAWAAPTAMFMEAISSSACSTTIGHSACNDSRYTLSSEAGAIG